MRVIGFARTAKSILLHISDGKIFLAVRAIERRVDNGRRIELGIGDYIDVRGQGILLYSPAKVERSFTDKGLTWSITIHGDIDA